MCRDRSWDIWRHAVQQDIAAYRKSKGFISGTEEDATVHVGHLYPFSSIVNDFCAKNKFTREDVRWHWEKCPKFKRYIAVITDKRLREAFRKYHLSVAKLRMQDAKLNVEAGCKENNLPEVKSFWSTCHV